MVDFRRVITALAVLALFVGLASAQVGGTGQQQLTCNTNVTVTPALRGEGYTEQTGDITITCTGGVAPTVNGTAIPLVNITVFYNTTVTSRLLASGSTFVPNEALLLIDEPGSGLTGDGPARAQKLCATPLTGCAAVFNTDGRGFGYAATDTTVTANSTVTGSNYSPNIYQGVAVSSTGNALTFFGVPVLPPTTVASRVYRITNVRVDATKLRGISASGGAPVTASISVSPPNALGIQNSVPNVGFVSDGLNAGVSNSTSLNQCESKTRTAITTLTFAENFGTAFKTRVAAQANTAYAGQIGVLPANPLALNQATPGALYNSESDFVFPIGSNTAGLADFGTRLKATFNNLPAGARIFVTTANVLNASVPLASVPSPIGGSSGNLNGNGTNVSGGSYVGYALLVNGETTTDGSTAPASGFFPSLAVSDNTVGGGATEISNVNGTATAVWEVLNTNPNTNESFKFGVYITYVASPATNSPLPGDSTVNLSYAPTASSGAATTGVLPRFAVDPNAARKIMTINVCRTILLYPYLTNQAGFDTGVTVANVTQDPFGTGAQAGSCKLNWYGGTTAAPTTPPAVSDTGNIAAGTVWANTLQAIAPTFQGYMIAVCNFQYAHGFAFISDVGARNLAMGYLAVVLTDGRSNTNTTTAENGGH